MNCAVAIYEPPISSKTCCFLSLTRNIGNKQEDCSLCNAMLGLSLVNKSPIQPFLLFPSPDQGNNGQIKTSFFVLFFFDSSPLCGLKFLSCVFQEHRRQKGKCWRFNQSSCVKDGSHISPIPMTIAALTPRAKIIIWSHIPVFHLKNRYRKIHLWSVVFWKAGRNVTDFCRCNRPSFDTSVNDSRFWSCDSPRFFSLSRSLSPFLLHRFILNRNAWSWCECMEYLFSYCDALYCWRSSAKFLWINK